MKLYIKIISVLLCLLLLSSSLFACAQKKQSGASGTASSKITAESPYLAEWQEYLDNLVDNEEKGAAPTEITDPGDNYDIIIMVKHYYSLQFKDYTVEDFLPIEVDSVRCLTEGTDGMVKAKMKGKTYVNSSGNAFLYRDNDAKVRSYHQMLCISLKEPDYEKFCEAIRVLWEFDEFLSVFANAVGSSNPNPTGKPDVVEVNDEDGEFAFLSTEEKQAILDTRKEMRNKYYPLSYFNMMYDYYGEYNGCHVFSAGGELYYQESLAGTIEKVTITVDGVDINYYSCSRNYTVFVYKNGEALEITEAFEKGWLTSGDIKRIAELHDEKLWTDGTKGHDFTGDLIGKNYSFPENAAPGALSEDALNNYMTHLDVRSSYDLDNIIHCGTYGGVAVFMYFSEGAPPTVLEGPNGERFEYKNNFKFILFRGNRAYHSIFPIQLGGFLEADDIQAVADFISGQ